MLTPSTIKGPEYLKRNSTTSLNDAIRAVFRTRAAEVTLINGLLRVLKTRAQQARLGAVRVIRIRLPGRAGIAQRIYAVQLVPVVVDLVGQAETFTILAVTVVTARAAAAETILGGLDALAQDDAVYEGEVAGEDLRVDLVDDGDGTRVVCRKGADLAPVAVFLVDVGLQVGLVYL